MNSPTTWMVILAVDLFIVDGRNIICEDLFEKVVCSVARTFWFVEDRLIRDFVEGQSIVGHVVGGKTLSPACESGFQSFI